jgi:hypothetical protein
MWDEEDGFFYDILRRPDGSATRLKVRSMVGLLPLCASTVFHGLVRKHMPQVVSELTAFLEGHPRLAESLAVEGLLKDGANGTRLLGLMDERKLRRVLSKMLDESEFLSTFGIRSLSDTISITRMSSKWATRNFAWGIRRLNLIPACSAAIPTGAGLSGCR